MRFLALLIVVFVGCDSRPHGHVFEVNPIGAAAETKLSLGGMRSGTRQAFRLRAWNPSGSGVEVKRVESGCECARLSPASFTVAPGESVLVELILDFEKEVDFEGQLGLQFTGFDRDETVVLRLSTRICVSKGPSVNAASP